MFQHLTAIPPDPILGLIAAHAKDPNPQKIDLGIGVYRDESGNTPMLDCVVEAEKILLATQTTKTYLGPPGVVGFNQAMGELILGKDCEALQQGRARTIQTPGGTGALRVGADLIKIAMPEAELWASDPTWANHLALFPGAGVDMHSYPYFDAETSSLRIDEMLQALQLRGPGDVVLFHACCHNPCGVSPDPQQWQQIADIAADRGFTPFVDIAYMGFERGVTEDSLAVRLFAEQCPELIVASSCSKNFAMYRERVGAITIIARDAEKAAAVESVIHNSTRKNYSMPPTHGPAVIDIILHSDQLKAQWVTEVAGMRNRINDLRKTLAEKIANSRIERDFSFIARQSGMFSFMGLTVDQVHRLRDEFAIYTVNSSRVNVASFNQNNMDYFVEALATVL
ncbi:MAG: aminotransferase class I/II-fold pyridoxal phosphate-dependent enzyme [Xanthomonadales bacterium]|nr:aminotransferase class I/II-fold pyridoxal phosphate-dependent enzyme [Xanthomonadales bacterium]